MYLLSCKEINLENKSDKDLLLETRKADRSFLNTGQLKIIACIIMLISHISQTGLIYLTSYENWSYPMTAIGRIAFPIFCFFIVQGVVLTSNKKKYLLRLFLFALISEIFFDLAFSGHLETENQNVFFTLTIGGLLISFINNIENSDLSNIIKFILIIFSTVILSYLAIFLKTDYSYKGVVAILLMYFARNSKALTALAIFVAFYFEAYMWGLVYLSILLLFLYNGKKGKLNKWAFYVFYPLHLFIIYLLKIYLLGIL